MTDFKRLLRLIASPGSPMQSAAVSVLHSACSIRNVHSIISSAKVIQNVISVQLNALDQGKFSTGPYQLIQLTSRLEGCNDESDAKRQRGNLMILHLIKLYCLNTSSPGKIWLKDRCKI